jgi:YHS domain-containing protein
MPYEAEPIEEIDPVCGMEVDPLQAHDLGFETEYASRRYVFCSKTCVEAFKADPARYLKADEEQRAI